MDFIRSREDRNNLYNNVDLTPRPSSESDTLLSVAMEIEHANNSGYVHGGTIMRLVDSDNPPLRMFLGTTGLPMTRAEYAKRLQVWEEWNEVAVAAQGNLPAKPTG